MALTVLLPYAYVNMPEQGVSLDRIAFDEDSSTPHLQQLCLAYGLHALGAKHQACCMASHLRLQPTYRALAGTALHQSATLTCQKPKIYLQPAV